MRIWRGPTMAAACGAVTFNQSANMQKQYPIEKIVHPIRKFISRQRSGGIVLLISVIIAMLLANSIWSEHYFHFLDQKIGFIINGRPYLEFDIHHWVNDGLMAMFFFVVGLELKHEIIAGELSSPRKAVLPIAAAIGGMLVPAAIYLLLNSSGDIHKGWGIPMATDIAFALGVLYLLGDKVPISFKVFLTALAIVDDLGAVLAIAAFYTSDISFGSLAIGFGFVLIMYIANKAGVRSIAFYALVGITGVWVAFLLSGVHATIAAVLAAFMIPANATFDENTYIDRIKLRLTQFKRIEGTPKPTLKDNQVNILEKIKADTNAALTPSQRLEYMMGPFVTFVVLPIFALVNAGVALKGVNLETLLSTNIALGVFLGLFAGKIAGVVGASVLFVKFKLAVLPEGMNFSGLLGVGFLASIGFTMSLFITSLAFTDPVYQIQAKAGVFSASIIGGVLGYMILSRYRKSK